MISAGSFSAIELPDRPGEFLVFSGPGGSMSLGLSSDEENDAKILAEFLKRATRDD